MSQLNLSPLEMERLIYERTAYATVSTLIHGIIIWDALDSPEWTLIYWPELQALWRRERFPAVPTMFLLFSRLVAFPIMSTSMTVMFGHPHSCAGVYRALLVLYATAVANGCAILVIRCTAIRSSKWPMKTALWLLWTVQTTAWLYASTISTITQIPKTSPYTTTCFKVEDFPSMSWLMYLSLTLFDFVILILTLQAKIKSFREIKTIATFWKGRKEDISQQFFRDTCLSFLVSTAASIVIVAWIYHHRQNQFYTSLMAPINAWVVLIIIPRSIRNLKLHPVTRNQSTPSGNQSQDTQRAPCFSSSEMDHSSRFGERIQQQPVIPFETSLEEIPDTSGRFFASPPRTPSHQTLRPSDFGEKYHM